MFKTNSSHNCDGWCSQFNRLQRWYDRLQTVRAESGQVGISRASEDYIYAFFQNCFHLRDWLIKSGAVPRLEVDQLFAASTELQLCRDVCNGTKHMTIDKPSIDANFYTFREYDCFHVPSFEDKPYAAQNFMIRAGGQKQDIFELADRCMKIWCEFLDRHGLQVTSKD